MVCVASNDMELLIPFRMRYIFCLVSEEKRQMYDQFGKDGMKKSAHFRDGGFTGADELFK